MSETNWEEKFWSVFHSRDETLKRAWKAENALREVQAMLEPLLTTAKKPEKDLNAKRQVFVEYLERAMEQIQKMDLDNLK